MGERARRGRVVESVRIAGVEGAGEDRVVVAAAAAGAGARRRRDRVVWVGSDRRRLRMLNVADIVRELGARERVRVDA